MTNLHYIWPSMDTLQKVGFSTYSAALSFMSISAFYFSQKGRYDAQLKFSSVSIFLGSLLFMISDVTLA